MSNEFDELAAENFNIFMEDGPRLSTRYNTWVEVVCSKHGRAIACGLGAFGHGRMWVDEKFAGEIPDGVRDDCEAMDDFGSTCRREWRLRLDLDSESTQ